MAQDTISPNVPGLDITPPTAGFPRAGADRLLADRGQPAFNIPALPVSRTLLLVGSSSEAGRGASSSSATPWMAGARENMYFMQSAKYVRDTLGIKASLQGDFGNHANADLGLAGYTAYDPRLSFAPGVTVSSQAGLGGNGYLLNPGSSFSMTIAFTEPGDTIEFWASTTAAGNKIEYSVDGGPFTSYTFAGTGSALVQRFTVSGLVQRLHTLTIRTPVIAPFNANSVQVHGFTAYDSSAPSVRFLFAGARSWNTTSTYWTSTAQPYAPMAMLPIVHPDVVIEAFGGNEDFTGASGLTDFISRCGTFHDAAVAAGAKTGCLIKPFRFAGAAAPGDLHTEYAIRDARIAFAKTRGIPYLDMSEASGPHSLSVANGDVQSDGLHYKIPWHDRVGKAMGYWLLTSGLLY